MIYFQILIGLLIITFFATAFIEHTLIIAPVKGLMFGALYNDDYFENEDIKEHTIQIVLLIISFTFIWETNG